MDTLLETCDLSDHLRRMMAWARSVHGHEARVMAAVFAVLTLILAWLSWYFDIDSTHEWVLKASNGLASAGQLADYMQIGLVLITLAPTLLRQGLAGPARQGLKSAGFLFFVVGMFDMQTDWPRVVTFADSIRPLFDMFGTLQTIIWYVFRVMFLLCATDLFELLTVGCFAVAVVLLRDKPASMGGRP